MLTLELAAGCDEALEALSEGVEAVAALELSTMLEIELLLEMTLLEEDEIELVELVVELDLDELETAV